MPFGETLTWPAAPDGAVTVLRRGRILLAVIGVLGTAVELGMERHWKSAVQRVVRAVMVAVFVSAALGICEHLRANYDAQGPGPLLTPRHHPALVPAEGAPG